MLTYDFGYEWIWAWGHAIPVILAAALAALFRPRPRWIQAALLIVGLWGLAGLWIVRGVFHITSPVPMPTPRFLASGEGRVVDLGAGSGRSTLMTAIGRPRARVVALDRFTSGYGIGENTAARLRANLEAGGVKDRVEIREGDMRKLPFANAEFQAATSAYAMDHLRRDDFRRALQETARILAPGGEFLFLTINRDIWVKLAYPLLHGGYYGPSPAAERWRKALLVTGDFEITEEGTVPGTLYFLCRKKAK